MHARPANDNEPLDTELYRRAVQIVRSTRKASTSFIQRQLQIGYNSASRLIEQMERDGIIAPPR